MPCHSDAAMLPHAAAAMLRHDAIYAIHIDMLPALMLLSITFRLIFFTIIADACFRLCQSATPMPRFIDFDADFR